MTSSSGTSSQVSEADGRWYAVQTLAGQEPVARLNLERQAYRAWYPSFETQVRHARQICWKKKALFPGYVFVRLNLAADRWHPINSTYGVARLVTFGGRPACLPEGVLETFQAASDKAGLLRLREALAPGDEVRVVFGSFADWVGEVVSLPDRDRVVVLLDMLSRKVPVTLARAQLMRTS